MSVSDEDLIAALEIVKSRGLFDRLNESERPVVVNAAFGQWGAVLAAADRCDRNNGIVRTNPADPATIERAAQAMYEHKMDCDGPAYSDLTAASKRYWRAGAAAVLASLTDTGDNKEQTE